MIRQNVMAGGELADMYKMDETRDVMVHARTFASVPCCSTLKVIHAT